MDIREIDPHDEALVRRHWEIGHAAEAEKLALEAVEIIRASDDLNSHGDALTDLVEVLRLSGRPADAAGTETYVGRMRMGYSCASDAAVGTIDLF